MKARAASYSSFGYGETIEIMVDADMLQMISNQLRIEITKAIEAHDDAKAVDYLQAKMDIDKKLKEYAEQKADKDAE
ncbi:MAG: hypothetical protein IKE94_08380 [Aeriscardovia sp.]|nr:hypothetical protein [Aeriscardovia sp.]